MNVMLLAAGRGQRMEPLSSLIAKPALEVLGEPLCATAARQLAAFGEPLIVNLHRHPRQVAAAVREVLGSHRVVFSWEPKLLGSAGGLAQARRYMQPGALLVGNADTVSSLNLDVLVAAADPDCCVLGLLPHPDPQRYSSVELLEDGRVAAILPRGASAGRKGFLFTGFQVLGSQVLAALPPPPGELAAVWEQLRTAGCLRGVVLHGSWQEAGEPESYRQLVLEQVGAEGWCHPTAEVAVPAELVHSAVGRGCRVAAGCRIVDTVLTAGAHVSEGCELLGCVVAGDVHLPPGSCASNQLLLPGGQFPLLL